MARRRPDPKAEHLRQQGCLHPHPEQVTDELFAASEFFDPRDLLQAKYEMLRRVLVDGHSVSQSAAGFGLSRPSYYQAQKAYKSGGLPARCFVGNYFRPDPILGPYTPYYQAQKAYESGGLPALLPKKPGPRRAHKLSEEVLEVLRAALATEPALSSQALAQLVEERFGLSVHRRSIERALAPQEKKRRR